MNDRKVNERLTVAYQIQPEDVADIAARGFTTIICNRPDGEEPGQPSVAEIKAAAEKNGLDFLHIPTTSGQFSDEVVSNFRAARQNSAGPVFAYCRTGTRCITLDALANPDGKSPDEIISAAAAAGYDLSPLRDRIAAG